MKKREIINPPSLMKMRLPLSHGVKLGNMVFVSGTAPFKDSTLAMSPDFAGQMHQVMANIKEILETAGSSIGHIVKANIILTRLSDFKEMNEIFRQYFEEGQFPARTTIEAPLAVPGMLLEIECIAEA